MKTRERKLQETLDRGVIMGAKGAAGSAKTPDPATQNRDLERLPFPAQKARGASVIRGAGRGGATTPHFTAVEKWGCGQAGDCQD